MEEDDDELDGKLNYKPPPQKSLKELQEMDKDDESLTKYKKIYLIIASLRKPPKSSKNCLT